MCRVPTKARPARRKLVTGQCLILFKAIAMHPVFIRLAPPLLLPPPLPKPSPPLILPFRSAAWISALTVGFSALSARTARALQTFGTGGKGWPSRKCRPEPGRSTRFGSTLTRQGVAVMKEASTPSKRRLPIPFNYVPACQYRQATAVILTPIQARAIVPT